MQPHASQEGSAPHTGEDGNPPSWPSGLFIGTVPRSVTLSTEGPKRPRPAGNPRSQPSRGERVQPRALPIRGSTQIYPLATPPRSAAFHTFARCSVGFPRRLINRTREPGGRVDGGEWAFTYCTVLYICTLLRSRAGYSNDDDTPHAPALSQTSHSEGDQHAASTHHPRRDFLPDAACMGSCRSWLRGWGGIMSKRMRLDRSARF